MNQRWMCNSSHRTRAHRFNVETLNNGLTGDTVLTISHPNMRFSTRFPAAHIRSSITTILTYAYIDGCCRLAPKGSTGSGLPWCAYMHLCVCVCGLLTHALLPVTARQRALAARLQNAPNLETKSFTFMVPPKVCVCMCLCVCRNVCVCVC